MGERGSGCLCCQLSSLFVASSQQLSSPPRLELDAGSGFLSALLTTLRDRSREIMNRERFPAGLEPILFLEV